MFLTTCSDHSTSMTSGPMQLKKDELRDDLGNRQPVLVKSPTGIGQIANLYWLNRQLLSLVYNFINTRWRFGQYRLAIWPIPVGDLTNTGWWFQNVGKKDMHNLYVCIVKYGQYRLAIWPIPVGNLANTGWQFGQYRLAIWPIPVGDLVNTGEGTFSKVWAGLRSKSGILKIWGY